MSLFGIPPLPRAADQALRPLTLLTLLALAGAAGMHVYLLEPAQENLRRVQTAYEEARRQAVVLKDTRRMQEQVQALERELAGFWTKLPAEDEFASMAIQISRLAGTVGVRVPGMTHSHKKAAEGLPPKALLVFQATGKYRNIYRFIHELERMEPYLVIEQVDAARATGRENRRENAVQFNVRVATFLTRPREEAQPS